MKKFRAWIVSKEFGHIDFEAESKQEAFRLAMHEMDFGDAKWDDGETEVDDVVELSPETGEPVE
jgi:hypothetical protein